MTVWTADTRYSCGWSLNDEWCSSCKNKIPGEDATPEQTAIFQAAVDTAADVLYALSGRQFGLCEVTVRPCRKACCDPCQEGGLRWTPALSGGKWINVSCTSCKGACDCATVCEVALPGPVESITQIRLNGNIVDPGTYRVDNRKSLVRLSGDCWPTCQDMTAPATDDNTWEVTYRRGLPVPIGGQLAMAELACEISLACLGDSCCQLPKRVTAITVDGATIPMLDPMTFIEEGKTGLYTVDLWLKSVNPKALSRGPAILSPDMVTPRRTTWP